MGSINVDHDSEKDQYFVTGTSALGDFVISGPWTTKTLAETHAQRIIGIFNEAALAIVEEAKAKSRIILQ